MVALEDVPLALAQGVQALPRPSRRWSNGRSQSTRTIMAASRRALAWRLDGRGNVVQVCLRPFFYRIYSCFPLPPWQAPAIWQACLP